MSSLHWLIFWNFSSILFASKEPVHPLLRRPKHEPITAMIGTHPSARYLVSFLKTKFSKTFHSFVLVLVSPPHLETKLPINFVYQRKVIIALFSRTCGYYCTGKFSHFVNHSCAVCLKCETVLPVYQHYFTCNAYFIRIE